MTRQIQIYRCQYPNCKIELESRLETKRKYCTIHRILITKEKKKDQARIKRNLKIGRVCFRCHGKLSGFPTKKYCTEYCRWLNKLKNHNRYVRKELGLIHVD